MNLHGKIKFMNDYPEQQSQPSQQSQSSQQPAYAQPGYQNAPPMGPPVVQQSEPKGLAITALVIGIAAFLLGLAPGLGIAVGVVAVIFGILAVVKKQPKALGLTGLILGAVGLLSSTIATIALVTVANMAS